MGRRARGLQRSQSVSNSMITDSVPVSLPRVPAVTYWRTLLGKAETALIEEIETQVDDREAARRPLREVAADAPIAR